MFASESSSAEGVPWVWGGVALRAGGGWPFGLGGGGPASRTGFGGGKLSLGHPPRGPETAVGNTVPRTKSSRKSRKTP